MVQGWLCIELDGIPNEVSVSCDHDGDSYEDTAIREADIKILLRAVTLLISFYIRSAFLRLSRFLC